MDISGTFFSRLRGLCLTLEKEVKQLEQALRSEDSDSEGECSARVLHDLQSEVKTLKEQANASFDKSCSENQAVHEFMKASEILMQRNAADLGKIRELFQKYGYKPPVKDSTDEEEGVNNESTVSESDEGKANDLPACTETPLLAENPLRSPRLSDFGLSQYAFSRPWSAVKTQHTTNAYQQKSRNDTPLKVQTPRTLPRTPKCKLKMDGYEFATPKLEHFGISEHTMCLNEDYTTSLIHKTAQTIQKLVKRDDNGGDVPEMTPREIVVTSLPKSNVRAENVSAADWMASPMVVVFCTPDVKVSSKTNSTVLPKSPETKELPLPSHTATPQCPNFHTSWLKTEAKVKPGGKIESVTKSDARDKQYKDNIPFAVSPDAYLKHLGDPSPPTIKHYDQLLNTPPPPEITRIPDDVLQILSKYNHKVGSSNAKETETKAGNTTRCESDSTDYSDKENRGYRGVFKPNI
ncbi:spindle and kinetochore-associated protein 3 isoform X2 [Myiozetetes cayanensis]|uniref:spindle and kinetochore-associated protein 3 isoform X2 n=1 Tax=Myiozetetes cayanensis TaxID=478635 RepID=UPI0021606C42|nr:spindle and kinetochore-associated protein 3 isoform X2 [Myiozetetes cayanensis]